MLLEELIKYAENAGLEAEDLDELVHDAKGCEASELNNTSDGSQDDENYDLKSEEASVINNTGLQGQIEYLVDFYGDVKEVKDRIENTIEAKGNLKE